MEQYFGKYLLQTSCQISFWEICVNIDKFHRSDMFEGRDMRGPGWKGGCKATLSTLVKYFSLPRPKYLIAQISHADGEGQGMGLRTA